MIETSLIGKKICPANIGMGSHCFSLDRRDDASKLGQGVRTGDKDKIFISRWRQIFIAN